ncbi:hypothetical protein [Alloprevotella tannerae]|uniref:hypothetical protein n=1 Tax=Alloprevotella tannerae TaxID=76122 RepID=UPI0028F02FB8|nr:hypothetical protein [Alloprevotella tannerae]
MKNLSAHDEKASNQNLRAQRPMLRPKKIKPKTDETDENRTNNKRSQTQNENKVSGRGHKRRRSGSEPLKHLALNGADAEKGNKV